MIDLTHLRKQIDDLDKELLELISKRLSIVSKVGKVKKEQGLPIYVPEREANMLKARREEAQKMGINPQLIEDVLFRLMQESYAQENNVGFHCVNPELGDVVIIGGKGQLGQLFCRLFTLSGYQVKILEQEDWPYSDALFANAGLVLVAVPISDTPEVIAKLTQLPKDCLLADVASIKSAPLAAMLKAHQGPVVGLHPMFGPKLDHLAKQVMLYCDGRMPESYQWLLKQFEIWGLILRETNAQEHDEYMQLIQALRHFTSFAFGLHLASENPDIKKLIEFSSPVYRLELMMVGRLFAQNGELYSDIIGSSKDNIQMIQRFASSLNKAIELIEENNKAEFMREFDQVTTWFKEYANRFLTESRHLLLHIKNTN